ncbi:T9SS type A sorting domain-containing protein [Mucilaginibacter sp.]|uniref:T9SS type A sorting domain-containing protein n=1 Tax=Mucilaginibacter sp. TaxID=1882438 RepID=UPI00284BE6B9|nr:T9SS type A sorting domain-containing protein [Mucilaginibacter sp.]MDR3694710.1 T9SS type A sorting domain-containing protein [Mucilaginibacter sp.]
MRRKFTFKNSWIAIFAVAIFMNFAFADNVAYSQSDTTYVHLLKSKQSKNSLHLVLPPLKPAVISTQRVNVYKSDDKILNNVQVYPNPVTDQINLKYDLSRYSIVTIKIVDVLGNDIITIFNQRREPGEQTYSYMLNNKLNRGFYFVRIYAGTESVIKRISVL